MAEVFWHNLSVDEVVKALQSDINLGLTEKDVAIRQREFGKNILPKEKQLSAFRLFWGQFRSPLIYILAIAGIMTLFFKEFTDSIVIFGAVFINTIIGFFQENKAQKTLRELKKIIKQTAEVKRGGNLKIIDSSEIVPGDIIILNSGDKAPSDARVLESRNLKVNEMVLTGEWFASEKTAEILKKGTPVADRDNMVYMGTVVEDGKAMAIATETGLNTEVGKIAGMIRETKEGKTPYQKKLSHFAKIVGIIIGFVSFGIFIEGIMTGGSFAEMFATSVAVAVAAIPEGLPVAMIVILALGMQRILKKQGLVRKLVATETLGSASIIATDKTATLTEGKMKVALIIGNGPVLKIMVLNSGAFVENPEDAKEKWIVRGRPTDRALLEAGIAAGIDCLNGFEDRKTASLPFDPINKFAAVLLLEENKNNLYVAGAPEIILSKCLLEKKEKEVLEKTLTGLTQKGLRVLAGAVKKDIIIKNPAADLKTEISDLAFAGFIALEDPLRPDAKEAVKLCHLAGLRPIIITGDHKLTARAVGRELGLKIKEENILEGKDLDGISEKDFDKILPKIQIYARVEPRHKMRIIEAWQRKGEVVAMTGDGINDAPALKKADIGIALGSGTEVAKETADLILLNDSFSIIVAAIEEGRAILDNIRKVITYLLSDSFTEVILIAGSMVISWLTGQPWLLPVLAGQILWVNLIEDGPLCLSLAFEPKEGDLMRQKPQNRRSPLLTGEMKALIFIIGLATDFFLLGLLFWLMNFSGYEISHIRSIIFAALAIDSMFYVFSCKSLRKNIWQINLANNKFLILTWILSALMLLAALYLPPLQELLKTVPLDFFDWQLILGLGLINIILIEATKRFFIIKGKNAKIS
ncbi:MAG: HAD-IC family P-type ATPase [bacterium]